MEQGSPCERYDVEVTEDPTVAPFTLHDFLRVLRHRAWMVLLAIVIVVGTALTVSLRQTATYEATTQLLVESGTPSNDSLADKGTGRLETEVKLIESQAVRALARKIVPNAGDVSAEQVGESKIVTVTVQGTDPEAAAKSAGAYAQAYIDFRKDREVEGLLASASQTEAKIDELQTQIDSTNAELEEARADIDQQIAPVVGESLTSRRAREQAADLERRTVEERLQPRRDAYVDQQIALQERLRDLQVDSSAASPDATVVSAAAVPREPISPKPIEDGLVALGLGLVLGVALASLFEYLDDSIKTEDDLRRAVGDDTPVVASIPSASDWKKRSPSELIPLMTDRSPTSEAFRSLRTWAQFIEVGKPSATMAVTSPSMGEGSTTTVAHLGFLLADAGRKVVILDCDLRRPRIHQLFNMDNHTGLSSVLIGTVGVSGALQVVPGLDHLSVLSSGPIPPNPSELLSSKRFPEVVRALGANGALVLIDSAALLPVTDAAIVARTVDHVLLVVNATKTKRRQVRRAVQVLGRVNAPLAGVVLNQADVGDAEEYLYEEPSTTRTPGRRTRPRGNATVPYDRRPRSDAERTEPSSTKSDGQYKAPTIAAPAATGRAAATDG
jgi:non-specific protein-tyrosine kinase